MLVDLDRLRLDGGTQPRAMIDYTVAAEYAAEMRTGAKFPPVVTFFDGTSYWVADGFHRANAADSAGLKAIECDVRQGTREDAVWFSCGANQGHGLRRTNADKRRAAESALRLIASGYKPPGLGEVNSDRGIAEHIGVSHNFVGDVRRDVQVSSDDTSKPRTGKDGKKYPARDPNRKPVPSTARSNVAPAGDEGQPVKEAGPVASPARSTDRAGGPSTPPRPALVCKACGEPTEGHLMHCPGCGEHTPSSRPACEECGADLRESPPTAIRAPEESPALKAALDAFRALSREDRRRFVNAIAADMGAA